MILCMQSCQVVFQFKYNIKDGMKLVENAASSSSGSNSGTSGKTTLEFSSGTYVGDVVNGVMQGKGTFTYTNGDIYEGDWVDGKRIGYGKYTGVDGSTYS